MKKLILTFAVCLFALNGMAQKHDWAGFGRFAKENEKVTTRPDAVFMGNSITEGWAYQDPEFFKQNN
ncbi:MAG: acylhydrolase, partial [Alistipes sp.]|nr:acylhydrolase [Alistipes sp.]